jgi:hypothetical protein
MKNLPVKITYPEIGYNNKKISSIGSSPVIGMDKVSGKYYDENSYSDEEKINKEVNDNISVNSLDNKNDDNNNKLVIFSSFSEINKKKDIGFTLLNKKDQKLNEEIISKIKDEIINKNNSEYCYYFIECYLHSLHLPCLRGEDFIVLYEKLYNLIIELLELSKTPEIQQFLDKNICNLCHVLFLSSNMIKKNIVLKDLVNIIDKYMHLFGSLYNRINTKIPDFLKNAELLGLVPESKKVFEYSLNISELNVIQNLNFANEDLIVVEIELINKNPEDYYPTNKDILLYTNYHSKSKLIKRNDISKNNYKDYGTCFLHKVSGGPLLDKKNISYMVMN